MTLTVAPTSTAVAEHRFRAMGTDVHVVVVGEGPGVDESARRTEEFVEACEARWSRFRPDSELSALNAAAGKPVVVSPPTFALIEQAVNAARATAGAFDPTVLGCLLEAGYDRSFEQLMASGAPEVAPTQPSTATGDGPARSAPGVDDIELVPGANLVRLPADVGLDLGGIAKGATADLVVADLLRADHVIGACVNIGGDLCVQGVGPDAGAWSVDLPARGGRGRRVARLASGGVCTSSTLKRWWHHNGSFEHHLRDAATGRSLRSGLVTATVIAASAAQAEVLTKTILHAGPGHAPDRAARYGVTGLVVDATGEIVHLPGLDAFLVDVQAVPEDGGQPPVDGERA